MDETVRTAVQRLIDMDSEVITAKDISPIVHINPDVLVHYAKTGQWTSSKFVISGNRVKFLRLDFLRKFGFLPEEPPEKDTLAAVLEELKGIREILAGLMERRAENEQA